jgi:hypothetical protein
MENEIKVLLGLVGTLGTMLGTTCLILGEIHDAPGLGGIGLILIGLCIYLNIKIIYCKHEGL